MKLQTPRVRLVADASTQAKALGGGLALLTPIYLATNRGLSGGRFLLAVVLAASAIVFLVEAFQRSRSNGRWLLCGGLGTCLAIASLLLVFLPAPQESAGSEGDGLRISLQPTAPDLFHLAFSQKIGLPSPDEGWSQLHRRGGIDIDRSHFRMVLTNDSAHPISVFSVHLEVLRSEEMPHGTTTWAYSQGDEGLDRLVAFLPDGRRGSVGRIYPTSGSAVERKEVEAQTPYFQSRYVSLEPGEVFPASLTVRAETPRTIEYRLIAEGESANHRFVVKSDPQQIVGDFEDPYQQHFARYYQYGHDIHDCTPTPDNPWVDARHTNRSLACPFGLGHPYETAPPSESEYPPGELDLSLQLAPADQSVTVSGVEVGAAPAAAPVPGVAKALLQALGTWTSCSVFFPSTSYWTAQWEAWELSVTFTSDGDSTDCTPRSRSAVQEIELRGSGEKVQTDLGSIALGSATVPVAVRRIAESVEAYEGEPEFLVPGVLPCNPKEPDEGRSQLSFEGSGGILVWSEGNFGEVLKLVTSLPDEPC